MRDLQISNHVNDSPSVSNAPSTHVKVHGPEGCAHLRHVTGQLNWTNEQIPPHLIGPL